MSKALKQNDLRARSGVRALAVTMTLSLAAFGCTTNQFQTAGEPWPASRAGGSVTPSMSTTPGSAGPSIPATMVSGAVDPVVDAMAVIEADRSYDGRVLGPAAPGSGAPSVSQQIATGQFISPAVLANPQTTVNRSVSSGPVPAVVSGGTVDAGAVFGGAIVGDAVTGGVIGNAGVVNVGNANVGATGLSNTTATGITGATSAATTVGTGAGVNFAPTGVSNTTATGITNATTAATNIGTGTNALVSTGAAAAPATASSVLATQTFGTSPRLNVDNTALARNVATTGGALTLNDNGLATNRVTTGAAARPGNVSNVRVVNRGGRVVVTNEQQ